MRRRLVLVAQSFVYYHLLSAPWDTRRCILHDQTMNISSPEPSTQSSTTHSHIHARTYPHLYCSLLPCSTVRPMFSFSTTHLPLHHTTGRPHCPHSRSTQSHRGSRVDWPWCRWGRGIAHRDRAIPPPRSRAPLCVPSRQRLTTPHSPPGPGCSPRTLQSSGPHHSTSCGHVSGETRGFGKRSPAKAAVNSATIFSFHHLSGKRRGTAWPGLPLEAVWEVSPIGLGVNGSMASFIVIRPLVVDHLNLPGVHTIRLLL